MVSGRGALEAGGLGVSQFGKEWRDYKPTEIRLGNGQIVSNAPKKRTKYGAVPTCVLPDLRLLPANECEAVPGRIRFASKREAERFVFLRLELEAGRVTDLLLQEQFALHVVNPQGVKVQIGTCRMDFTYTKDGQRVREDSKSAGTKTGEAYRQRKKHVEAEHGITVVEV